ncbi:hypothetical protein FACS1894127_3390 [Clostridia bacterium]|nr:hypothetical protein FACS1894127_3390 [Clostridia bacterium]
MGYYIAEPFWKQGITTVTVEMLCAYVFENTDIIRIFAEPFAYNTVSCRVLEKLGFKFERTLRQNAVKNGKVIDMKMLCYLERLNNHRAKTAPFRLGIDGRKMKTGWETPSAEIIKYIDKPF